MCLTKLSTFVLLFVSATLSAQVVQTDAGLVRGTQTDGLFVFKGIPFAAPPTATLRWREPQPAKPWAGTLPTIEFAPAPMQSGVSMPGEVPPQTSEDCLYLNIWSPKIGANQNLPVIVWIYGGGFTNGNAAMPLYSGDRLALKGAVVVTFGYRLGPLGFLASPELTAESPHHTSGNYGLLDQIAALRWVKRNIASFGGDPNRVTIAGQSSGAISVSILIASPLANGLFRGAIAQSGGLFEPIQMAPNYLLKNAEKEGSAFTSSLGVNNLAALRALGAKELFKGNANQVSHPVVDAYVLPYSPYDAYVQGKQNDVPLLIGSNADEARSLVSDLRNTKASTFAADIENR
jgi:para-nitrobenzyl esterase